MDPLDDAFNTIRNTLNDLRKRVAALERAQPAAQPKSQPGAWRIGDEIHPSFWEKEDYEYRNLYSGEGCDKVGIGVQVLTALVEQAPSLDALLKVKNDNGRTWDFIGDRKPDLFKPLDAAFRKRMGFFEQQNMEAA